MTILIIVNWSITLTIKLKVNYIALVNLANAQVNLVNARVNLVPSPRVVTSK